ncbi:MAG: type II toxin-antitoxin system VapC family toxin, partial [Proteobacteria bacterium]|nr:type II toxin-antitoxin system VapC family toxin [Pseudomonadota bacterium]
MNYLIDTHILLWSLFEPGKLRSNTRNALLDQSKQIFVSTISFWEISLKYSLGKLELIGDVKPEDLVESCIESGFDILELDPLAALTYYRLPKTNHKDPFDRLLI